MAPSNSEVARIVENLNQPTGPRAADPDKTGIVHFGLNKYARDEAIALNKANRDEGGAYSIRDQESKNQFKDGGKIFDLTTPEAAAAYTSSLGMSDDQAIRTAELLGDANLDATVKDELAHLVKVLSQADTGERDLQRLVLSGHSVGKELWGDDNGEVTMDQLESVFAIFPNASKSIKHLMMSACSSGGELAHERYRQMLPGLESSVGYLGSSPGTHSGAIPHLKRWEKLTDKKGGVDLSKISPDMAKRTRKGENMSTWDASDGFQANAVAQVNQELDDSYNFDMEDFEAGAADLSDRDQYNALRGQYDRLRRIEQNPDASPDDREWARESADHAIRLLHYDDISERFMAENGDDMRGRFAGLGETMPDFARLSRGEALGFLADQRAKLPQIDEGYGPMIDWDNLAGDQLEHAYLLSEVSMYLDQMEPHVVPNDWL